MNMNMDLFSEKKGFNEHKDDAIQLLKKLVELLNKYNIEFFLISGTLLGYCRHNDFIPWDDDIDIIVSPNFLTNYKEILREINDKEEYDFYTVNDNYFYKFFFKTKVIPTNNGKYFWPFIDIFIYNIDYNINNNERKYINFFNINWKYEEFFPGKKVLFNGLEVFIPINPDYFLKINYGEKYMDHYISPEWNHRYERLDCISTTITADIYNKQREKEKNKDKK